MKYKDLDKLLEQIKLVPDPGDKNFLSDLYVDKLKAYYGKGFMKSYAFEKLTKTWEKMYD